MNEMQANLYLTSSGARFVTTKQGVDWWKLPNGEWLGKRTLPTGLVEVRHFPANACGC